METKPKKPWYKKWWVIVLIIVGILIVIGIIFSAPEETDTGKEKETKQATKTAETKNPENSMEVAGQTIKVGDLADDVFKIVTEKYKIASPTIEEGKVTHHFLDGKTLFDLTFEKNEAGNYILTKITIKDTNYQPSAKPRQAPVSYKIGHTSGYLATIAVPKGTTKAQLTELLKYFHSLHKNGKLNETMKGHTIIDIFDDEKWTIKDNYDIIIRDGSYCNYIKAQYGVDSNGVESASIGYGDCPNYEKITF